MDTFIFKLKTSLVKRALIVGAVAVAASLIFIFSSINLEGQGYPLDDAWIHQTYARNLAEFGDWAFIPGQVSGGSTSPLWTAILAAGHGMGIPALWTYIIGIALLAGSAIFAMEILLQSKCSITASVLFGLFVATEWHLAWASGSGMETILFIFLLIIFFFSLQQEKLLWMAGLIAGISVWVRPDSLTLIGPFLWVFMFSREKNWKSVSLGLVSFFLLIGGYLVFNNAITGTIWPNTFYAKQAEYAALRETPLGLRFMQLVVMPWIGASVLLLPGLFVTAYEIIKLRKFAYLAPILWAAGYIMLFAVRLPATYQHGRYIMPAMPVLFMVSTWGVQELLALLDTTSYWRRILRKSWLLSLGITQVFFLILGAQSYAKDVAVINTEMVRTAKWIEENSSDEALIAAHDIGALGYFSDRSIIDLAGLISPEVIPFIRDEERLAEYISDRKADYLVIFPSWYPSLADSATPVYHSNGDYSPGLGGENMFVYKWHP